MKIIKNNFLLLIISLCLLLPLTNCTIGNTDTEEYKFAFELATLDNDGYVPDTDPSIRRFRRLVSDLSEKYKLSEKEIGEKAYKTKLMGKDNEVNLSMLLMMEAAIKMKNLSYEDILSKYLRLSLTSFSHDEVMDQLILLDKQNK